MSISNPSDMIAAMRGEPLIRASEKLESIIFKDVLLKDEILALRRRAEIYQQLHQNDWAPKVFRAYSQYFGFLTSLKVRAILEEIEQEKMLPPYSQGLEVWDIGAGTLGASLGAIDFFSEKNIKIQRIHAVDVDLAPTQWAGREFSRHLPELSLGQQWKLQETTLPRLILLSDVLNETSFEDSEALIQQVIKVLKSLKKDDLLIIIEPATKVINQKVLAFRDRRLQEENRTYNLLLPCTHEKKCPALQQGEWCHEEREFRAPQAFWTLVQKLGFERRSLVFSTLVFGGQQAPFRTSDARIVSRNLKSKGKVEKWLCADGKRWKARLLKRHKKETLETYEATRGVILDCHSTGLLPPE